jgi:DNA-binding response OmpR family regulator
MDGHSREHSNDSVRSLAPRRAAVQASGPGRRPRPAEGAAGRRLAVLDSDSGFLVVLGRRLQLAGWSHRVLAKSVSAKKAASLDVDALVVDTGLLGAKALNWLKTVCDLRPDLAVIVCTAESTVVERISGLRNGVDDWVAKPAHPEELIARIETITVRRRASELRVEERVTVGRVEIRPDQFQAFVDGDSLGLTRREYQLLELLCHAEGEILPRERIYECLWGYEMVRNDRSVDVFVHKLRRKIEQRSPGWAYIHTHFGVGYWLDPRPAAQLEPAAPLAA